MRFKKAHRTKSYSVGGSYSGDVEYCEDDVCGINIEIEDDQSSGDGGGGCDYG